MACGKPVIHPAATIIPPVIAVPDHASALSGHPSVLPERHSGVPEPPCAAPEPPCSALGNLPEALKQADFDTYVDALLPVLDEMLEKLRKVWPLLVICSF